MRRIVTIQYKPNQGPIGPQGPAGPGTTLPLDSSDVLYTPTGQTVEQVLSDLLFVAMDILSFATPQIIFELGQVLTSMTFTWVLSKNPLTQTITGPSVVPPTLTPSDRTKAVTLSNLDSDESITLTVDDGNSVVTDTIDISFVSGVFTGSAPIPGAIDGTFVNTLNKSLQANADKEFTVNLTVSQYGWYAWPVSYGLVDFMINGFNGGMTTPTIVAVQNGYFFTQDYYVCRTENPSLGITTIKAQPQ